MRRIAFPVLDEPPKKWGKRGKRNSGSSMWGDRTQANRLCSLRGAAHQALGSQSIFTKEIRLTLRVHVGADTQIRADLDNYIAGVCDGLKNAQGSEPGKQHIHESLYSCPVSPTKPVAIKDDSEVVSIDAKVFDVRGDSWYVVVLEGE